MGEKYAFVMMIQNKWWQEFHRRNLQGKKIRSYVQKGLAPPKDTSLILFYLAKPVGEIAGHAEFVERKTGDSEELWKKYGRESVLDSREQFKQFIEDRPKASFVRFRNLHEAATPIPLKNVLMLLGVKRLSRKGFYVNRKTAETLLAFME
ncbi:MAG: hypothetical protein WAN53_01675 [Candidatus Bathyarchaeia archaeon]